MSGTAQSDLSYMAVAELARAKLLSSGWKQVIERRPEVYVGEYPVST